MNKYVGFAALFVFMAAVLFVAQDASANAEDMILGVVERLLDMLAGFFDAIFQSIADAVKDVLGTSDSKNA